jgi:putative ABC transport system permease protein
MSEYQDFPGVQAATRVGRYRAQATIGDRNIQGVYLGVDRADFSQAAFWRSDFSIDHPAELMNALAYSPDAVLVSRSFARENGLRVGDLFRLEVDLTDANVEQLTQIVGFFDYFPSWYPEEGPLFVGNLEALYTQAGGDFPYEVWLTTKGLPDVNALEDALTDRKLFTWRLEQPYTAIAAEQNRPERQGMFGLLSVGFISAALLTVLGFFIYARLSFRQRMVPLGILRAVGLSSRQMGIFLAFELAFLILSGLTMGTGLGALINSLYIPYLQVGNGNAIPPYLVEMGWRAVLQIYVLFILLFVAALTALVTQLRRMKIFEAIKLGETV